MKEIDERLLNILTFEVLSAERRNLRSKALTDQKMSEEIQKIIIDKNHRGGYYFCAKRGYVKNNKFTYILLICLRNFISINKI